ncbi:MAG: glycosyltransferase family 4 protein, partial [Candidatus Atribacteria bacterium]|nr:glycosyltransferase family 4 protein [Candidatus Atribacteria bacterium]
ENTYWLYSPRSLEKDIPTTDKIKNIVVSGKRFWTLLALSKELKKNPPDVFWSPSNFFPYNLPQKSVATIHDLAFHLFPHSYSWKSRLLSRFTLKRAIKSADKLIAVSRQTKKDLKRCFNVPGENIEVIYHSLRTDFQQQPFDFQKNYPGLDQYFIYVGRLELRKNLPNIIIAFHNFLSQTDRPVKLLLAGPKGYGYRSIKQLIKKLALKNKVIFKDYIPAEHLPTLYEKSLGVIFVSRYEGFGLNILEGFAAGVPVMTSNFGAMAEIAGNAALLVNPFNPKDISDGFYQLYSDTNLRQTLVDKGKIRLEDFDWKKSAQKLIELWKTL